MNKKNSIKRTAALLLGIALTAGSTGCNFIVKDNAKDLAQTVAEVNISAGLKNDAYFIKARDCTFTKENLEVIKEEQTLKGFFVREMLYRLENCEEDEKAQLTEALRLGLAALANREVGYLEN